METAMTSITQFEQLMAVHSARVARVNREGWKWQAATPTKVNRGPGVATFVSELRASVGMSLIGVGKRLQGNSAGQIGDPSAAI
jgi:hypothetical protein